jgi:hypothetical protein
MWFKWAAIIEFLFLILLGIAVYLWTRKKDEQKK